MHKETLQSIAVLLNEHGIHWGLGGSSLLAFHGMVQQPNDVDLFVTDAHASAARDLLMRIGEYKAYAPKEPYCTKHFYHFQMGGTGVDVMGLFGIRHAEGMYHLDWQQGDIDRTQRYGQAEIPLTALEDWFVLYLLIPGRTAKADLIEQYWSTRGLMRRDRLEAAMGQPLPQDVRRRIQAAFEKHAG